MPENLDGLNNKQLKVRKVLANDYKKELEEEIVQLDKYITRVTSKMTANPNLQDLKLEALTVPQLEELMSLYGKCLLRVKGLGTKYQKKVEKIDTLIMEKR